MLCDRIQDNLSAYIDGEAGPELTAEVDRHLRTCDNCRRLLNELRAVSGLLNSVPQHAAPSTLAEDLQIRLERQMLIESEGEPAETAPAVDRRLAQRRSSVWPRVAAVAACLLLAAGITLLLTFPPGRKALELADTLGELESRRIAAIDTAAETKDFHDESVDSDGITRGEKGGSFAYKMEETRSLSATADGRAVASPKRGGERWLEDTRAKADREGGTPTQELFARAPLKAGWRGLEAGRQLGKQGGSGTPLPMWANNLFLVTTNGADAEKELNVVLEQAGIVNAKRRRETFEPSAVAEAQQYYRNMPAPETVAAGEQVEVTTVEANINAEQFAALNYAVANNSTLVVQDVSDGMFAATAPTQRVMLQVPPETRLRELASNSIIQDNLKQAAARRTRGRQIQSKLAVDLLRSQPDGDARAAEKGDRRVEAKPAHGDRDVAATSRTVTGAEETEEQRQKKAKGVEWYAARKPEEDIKGEKEAKEAAEPTLRPATEGVAKEPAKKIAEQPTTDAPADQQPAETVDKASRGKPAASGPGKSVETDDDLARKPSAAQERIVTSGRTEDENGRTQFAPAAEDKQGAAARGDLAGLTERRVAGPVPLGLQAQRESDEALIPIMIQLVAHRVRPPGAAAEETEAEEAARKARAGDVQPDVKSETGPAP